MSDGVDVRLRAPNYALGDIAVHHTEIPGFAERTAGFGMVDDAAMWGWGVVHRAVAGLADLAVRSASRTLREARVAASEVDAVVLCSTTFPATPEEHAKLVDAVLTGLRLGDVEVVGVTLNRCANLLVGLRVAHAMVAGGERRQVLVVSTDRIAGGATRVADFALFSDGAASALVSADPVGYRWLAAATAVDRAGAAGHGPISSDLARVVNRRLTERSGVAVADVDALLHSNIYLPIVTMKELQAGFTPAQLDTTNTARVGHCFAADPLINLVDRERSGRVRPGGHYLLASSVAGLRVGVLVVAPGERADGH